MKKLGVFGLILVLMAFCACTKQEKLAGEAEAVTLPEIDISGSPNGIVTLPDNVPSAISDIFVKYTKILAPNGKPIHFLAQKAWTDVQIAHARNVLSYLLEDFPGSEYGNNKSIIANKMADRKATMVLFNTPEELQKAFDTPLREVDLSMQDLRANECPAEGTEDYMNHITRDAAYEEIWHLVHDNGVKLLLPDMIAEMRQANDTAAEKGWKAWPEDEPQEHPNEYVGVLIDNYLDLWTVRPKKYEGRDIGPEDVPDNTSHFGRYFANSREKLKNQDPLGYALFNKFFHPYLTYTPILPEDFEGTFSLAFDESLIYTYKSQHLINVTLAGSNNAELIGNAYGNKLTGNKGDNMLTGGAGNDTLDGGEGKDIAVFAGAYSEYTIIKNEGYYTITDSKEDRDGADVLKNIEELKFSDRVFNLSHS